MPPRAAPGGGGGGGRGRGRGGGPSGPRGGGQGAGRGAGGGGGFRGRAPPGIVGAGRATGSQLPDTSAHITTIGVKRPSFGQSGRALAVWTNHFEVKIPEANIHHYDGAFVPICSTC